MHRSPPPPDNPSRGPSTRLFTRLEPGRILCVWRQTGPIRSPIELGLLHSVPSSACVQCARCPSFAHSSRPLFSFFPFVRNKVAQASPVRETDARTLSPGAAMAAGNGRGAGQQSLPSQEMLDDLCSRFVLNAPEEELESFDRVLFLLEQAHWFYEDNTMEQNTSLKSLSLREFTSLMFKSCAALRPYIPHFDGIYKDFTSYKISVPVTGAIILDETFERCLMVKGWKAGASWSFPKGKKNKNEEDHTCAIREVWEETGFDITPFLKLEDHLEVTIGQQRSKLYIVGGVSESSNFVPQTKKEISEIAWHRIDDLPTNSNETSHNRGPTGLKYFMVWPFVGPLRSWVAKHKPVDVSRTETSSKGITVYKASTSGQITFPVISQGLNQSMSLNQPSIPKQQQQQQLDLAVVNQPVDEQPGKSFRNFMFDVPDIVSHMD